MRQKWMIEVAGLVLVLFVAAFWLGTAAPADAATAAPASFSGTATAGAKTDTVTLTWVAPAGTVRSYTIQSADFTSGLKTYTVLGTAKSFTTPALPKGNTYYFRLRANMAVGMSAWSPILTVTTP